MQQGDPPPQRPRRVCPVADELEAPAPSPARPLLRHRSYFIFLTMYVVLKDPEMDPASGPTTSGRLLPTASSALNESLRIGRCPARGDVLLWRDHSVPGTVLGLVCDSAVDKIDRTPVLVEFMS